METICLVVPTISRLPSLFRTIETFRQSDTEEKKHVAVIVDDNRINYLNQVVSMVRRNKIKNIEAFFNNSRLGWCRSMNRVFNATDFDFYFYGSDDLTFERKTVTNAIAAMRSHFPDGDGVVGINQNLMHFCKAAFGLVGRKFVNRFPARQVFYPYYKHFCGDSELWHFAQSISKFYFCPAAMVHHARPMDECKKLAQTTLRRDREIWWKKKGKPRLYWGHAFLKPAEFKNEVPCRRW